MSKKEIMIKRCKVQIEKYKNDVVGKEHWENKLKEWENSED